MDYVVVGAWWVGGFTVLVVAVAWLGKIFFGYSLPSFGGGGMKFDSPEEAVEAAGRHLNIRTEVNDDAYTL